ncbi:dTDP-4-amino-4,6-dideoxygalactose transaminase [Vibrio sp. S/42/10]|uniref:dTDP-4-amino-4,6-dideoxygalactose transaminase n=1 Tax=Vibrio sp. S/42/10 TaxID=2914757 RepID=UPI0024697D80|nr:dTDP-4-amino-4,6-dideoxygalactose transaminase [Vibrio sp. S/42/10]MDH5881561.1 dTDP-4-amino-4,6-dideoxygalactose transaminase [Vibrio sp. S/42/10]
MIPFNTPPVVGTEIKYIKNAIESKSLCGDGIYSAKCQNWFEHEFHVSKCLMTSSCTHALEMAAMLIGIEEGDEVILPSYTFVSTANAFVLRGAKIIFVDIRKDNMNIDESKIEAAITNKTKAIVPVHYAGVACEMDTIMDLAKRHGLFVIEDAAQGVMSSYKGKALGSIGHLGAFSFHETKNYTSGGEGGLLLINDEAFVANAEILREKGTNRSQFIEGIVDKYTWVGIGSSYLPSELQCAYLYAQLECAYKINDNRIDSWNKYYKGLVYLKERGLVELPSINTISNHNAHMFYIKVKDSTERKCIIEYLKSKDISSVFHYVPLHSSPAGKKYGNFIGDDIYTTIESERILRLPLYFGMKESDIDLVIRELKSYFNEG